MAGHALDDCTSFGIGFFLKSVCFGRGLHFSNGHSHATHAKCKSRPLAAKSLLEQVAPAVTEKKLFNFRNK